MHWFTLLLYSASGKYLQCFTFSTFCYVTALFQNWLYSLFSSNFYKQYPIMTMCKKFVWNLCKCIKNKNRKNNHIRIHSLCSILCWSTFDTNYSLKSFGVWCYKLGTPIFGQFLPFFFAGPLQLYLVGWVPSVYSRFQISPEMFNRVQVWALAGPLKDIHSFVILAVCLGSLSCWIGVLRSGFLRPIT